MRDRGLRAPVVWIGDGALGAWGAGEQVWPEMAQQRCWNHKIVNVLDALPKRVQPRAKPLLTQIPVAPTRAEAVKRRDAFAQRFRDEFPEAVATLERDWDRMVTYDDFPEEHWKHLRTSNPVESPFAAVRLRTDAGKRYKRVAGATALIWRLLMVAEQRFRKLNGSALLPEVYAGTKFEDGQRVESKEPSTEDEVKEAA